MSTNAGKLYHPISGTSEEIYEGFSWPCLVLGCIWYFYKGMLGWGAISLILAFVSMGISWLIFPFFANDQHSSFLIKQGYISQQQWKRQKGNLLPNEYLSDESDTKKCPVCAERIKREAIKCRFCGEKIFPEGPASEVIYTISEGSFDDRVLCRDGRCIGIIGPNGRCTVCGRPYKNVT